MERSAPLLTSIEDWICSAKLFELAVYSTLPERLEMM